jgi:parallel beta-helix repeat protein/predicted outer membrane repeat protein
MMKNCVAIFFVFLLASLLFPPSSAIADTYYVPDDFTIIQDALDSAVGGDILIVRDGIYAGLGNKNLDFGGKALTLRSENGPANCIIDGGNFGRGFYFHSGEGLDSIVDGFTIINCRSDDSGGAIYCDASSPSIINCIFMDNVASEFGGAIYCASGSSPEITNSRIENNIADWGGGIYGSDSSLTLINGFLIGNRANNCGGGGYWLGGSPTILNCTISANSASYGGGIDFCDSLPLITNCNIIENTAIENGGGLLFYLRSSATVTNCTISGNFAGGFGGGMSLSGSSVSIINSILWQNAAVSAGPEIRLILESMLEISYCDVDGGQPAAYVGPDSILNWGEGNIDKDPAFVGPGNNYHLSGISPCVDAGIDAGVYEDIDGDPRPLGGGYDMGCDEVIAFCVPDDYPTIKAAIQGVADNSVIIVRDGVYSGPSNRGLSFNGKTLTLRSQNGPVNCIIDCGNAQGGFIFWAGETNAAIVDGFTVINGDAGFGGGVYCTNSSPTIRNCIFKGGSSAYGGGICLSNSSARIINCTITGNSGDYGAGGIFFYGSDATVTNCTISDNTAVSGGGVFGFSSTPTFTNCIITGNSATYGPQILLSTSTTMSVRYSNVEGGQAGAYLELASSFAWGVGNIDADPLFVGGSDYHLTYNSPCVNAGLDTGLSNDVDGDARPLAGGCDMGSDEFSTIYHRRSA